MIRYFELGFGYKEDEDFGTGDYEEVYSMAIKADHYPSFEEVERFVEEDMKEMGYTGINSITEIDEWEVHSFFNDDNIENWKVLTNDNKTAPMNGATKFVDWLLEMGYLDKEDISIDGVEIAQDMNKVKTVAPKFYNMLMCMCNCDERV